MNTNRSTNYRSEIIDRAATTLRRLLQEADDQDRRPSTSDQNFDPGILVDHKGGQLIAGSGAMVVGLDRLAVQLLTEPPHHHPQLIDEFVERAVASSSGLSKLQLGKWSVVEPLLRVRLVPEERTGPLTKPLGHGVALDIGIDLPEAVVTPTAQMLDAWGMSAEKAVATARANMRQGVGPIVGSVDRSTLRLTTLSGHPWATGTIVDLDHFLPPTVGIRWAAMLNSTTLAVLQPAPTSDASAPDLAPPTLRSSAPASLAFEARAVEVVTQWFEAAKADRSGPTPPSRVPPFNLFRVDICGDICAVEA